MRRLFIIIPLFCALAAHCGHISLDILPSSSFSEGKVEISATITNSGDEAAHCLALAVDCFGRETKSEPIPAVKPGETATLKVHIGEPSELPGMYQAVLRVHYQDANGYNFTALRAAPIYTAFVEQKPASISVKSVQVAKFGTIKAVITPSADIPYKIRLALPDEFSFEPDYVKTSLQKDSKQSVEFFIENKSALNGSVYLAYMLAETEINGVHIDEATPFNIIIAEDIWSNKITLLLVALLVALMFAIQFKHRKKSKPRPFKSLQITLTVLCFVGIYTFLAANISPKLLLTNTTTVGGDTPAHNYMASHLKKTFFNDCRVVSWAGGWWCGFPMFQYYFCLPYLLIALLSVIIPFNIAFKIVSVSGIFILPAAMFVIGKKMKLPRPASILFAIAAIPFLFDNTHTMWGVNIYSTFAGMISNSISFAIMLFFIAMAAEDGWSGQFRFRTVFAFVLLMASHFFTSVVAGMTLLIIPFLKPKCGFKKAFITLAGEAGLGILMMAWWLIPLLAKKDFSMEFGVNWPIEFFSYIPKYIKYCSPLLIPSAIMIARGNRPLILVAWMFVIALLLFFFGFNFSSVFVNIRLWPFYIFALTVLEAAGLAILLGKLHVPEMGALSAFLLLLSFGIGEPNHVPIWTSWNYKGLEMKERAEVFEKLVIPLTGTPGRLANDLSEDNNLLGSSRIFELTPHLTGKPILEGGIVNSAVGSLYSYYVQGETSENCAGFPNIVKPTQFNMENGTKHLKLFNVKHFIAKWEETQKALAASEEWKKIDECEGWELYEMLTNDGGYVYVPEYHPNAIVTESGTKDWKHISLEWIYDIRSLDTPFILLKKGNSPPAGMLPTSAVKAVSHFKAKDDADRLPFPEKTPPANITNEEISDSVIRFHTDSPGLPHIIKCTYYPDWKSDNGEKIFMVTPCFMLIYPEKSEVVIRYVRTAPDKMGITLSIAGLVIAVLFVARRFKRKKASDENNSLQTA